MAHRPLPTAAIVTDAKIRHALPADTLPSAALANSAEHRAVRLDDATESSATIGSVIGVGVYFEHTAVVEAPVEVVFNLSLDMDAHVASMARSGERIVDGVRHGRMGLGDQVTFRARHFGIPFTLTSRVTELDEPQRFVDEQVEGPFRSFHHEHLFRDQTGATVMVDRVRFDAPLGFVGLVAERVLLGRYLRQLIEQRSRYTKQEAERRAS